MDAFIQARKFAAEKKDVVHAGIYPFFMPLSETEGTEVAVKGHRLIMIGSNNYLGLTTHPKVREAALHAVQKYGTSCTGSRFLNGTLELHEELEHRLAKFLQKEAALVFSTGYQTNLGTISTILGKNEHMIVDRDVHACIIDGWALANGNLKRYRHNQMDDLEKTLRSLPQDEGKLVAVDGVFSMEGDLANLPEIVPLCQKYNARLLVDDAHSIGVMGPRGEGTGVHFGLQDQIDLVTGTFSKAFASLGGVVAGNKDIIDYIKHFARPFIFSASMPPSNIAAALAALDIMEQEPEHLARLWKNTEYMRRGFQDLGFDTGHSVTPVIPIIIGGSRERVFTIWRALFDAGVFVNPVIPPAVPPRRSLLRTSYMATHTTDQLDRVLEIFKTVGKKFDII
ncbi:MAG: aminotransferase class I/II-fold pyridoxal phosphate-dependent enzyme [Gemmatimonadetes bacterium]|nr:MAG: aminotransferase class I/II-fold pyridoxal phosphate-dependent enzyme [Gemmatimonadota bacterium]